MRNLILLITYLASFFLVQVACGKDVPTDLKKYVFKINGKITYVNESGLVKGLYGARVVLHMLKKGDGMIAQPAGIGLDPKSLSVPIQPDGSFKFDLQMLANMAMFDKFFVEIYPKDEHGAVYYDSLQFITKSSVGKVTVWNKKIDGLPFRGIELPFYESEMNHIFNDIKIEVMPNFGGAVRYLKIANEFGKCFYKQLNKNIAIPFINVNLVKIFEVKKYQNTSAGYFDKDFDNSPKIYLKFESANDIENTTAHEYGHYLHYLLNKKQYPTTAIGINDEEYHATRIFYETIAVFANMAIRNYSLIIYNDPWPSKFNNLEKLPFDSIPFAVGSCSYCKNHDIPRCANFLWNLYDGPSQKYNMQDYTAYDNDDVDGEKDKLYKLVFDKLLAIDVKKSFSVKNTFKEVEKTLSAKFAGSLNHISKFLFEDTAHKMQPVQVKSAKLTILGKNDHMLVFGTNNYLGDVNYKNLPIGYRFYGEKNNSWFLIKEIPDEDKDSYLEIIPTKEISQYKNFKITSYNNSGESLHPIAFVNSSLPIAIEGPADIFADLSYQWEAKVTGGTKPIKYAWKMKKVNANEGFDDKDQYGYSSIYKSTAPEGGQDFILQVWVTDYDYNTGYGEKLINTTVRPLKGSILGPPSVIANVSNEWKAEVSGGIPPYTYNWIKQTEGSPNQTFLGQVNSCNTKSDKPFTLKLIVKDSLDKSIVIEKQIQLNILAPINPVISGDKLVYLHENTSSWKVNVTGGEPPYQITWQKKYENEFSFTAVTQGTSYQKSYGGKEGVFYLKTIVKDANGFIKESVPFKVTSLYQPLFIVINNENVVVKAGEKINWQADIAGGKPAYYCSWKVGKDLNNLSVIKEGFIGYEFHPGCEYQSKFNKPGKYFVELTVKDTLGKSMTIYKEFMVQGMDVAAEAGTQNDNTQPVVNFTIYPNPAPGFFTLSYTVSEDAKVSLSLISINDNKESGIYQQQLKKGVYQKTFNTSIFPVGNYILKYTQKDAKGRITVTTDKIILLK